MTAAPRLAAVPDTETGLSGEGLIDAAVFHGAQLVRAVRGVNAPDVRDRARARAEVARLLAAAPDGRLDVLAIALAGMVPAGRHPAELLAWTVDPAVEPAVRPAPHGTLRGYRQHQANGTPTCRPCGIARTIASRPKVCREEFTRLVAAGVDPEAAATLSLPSFVLAHPRPVQEPA